MNLHTLYRYCGTFFPVLHDSASPLRGSPLPLPIPTPTLESSILSGNIITSLPSLKSISKFHFPGGWHPNPQQGPLSSEFYLALCPVTPSNTRLVPSKLWLGVCHCSIKYHDFSHLHTSMWVASLSVWENTPDPWKCSASATSPMKPSLIISSLTPPFEVIPSSSPEHHVRALWPLISQFPVLVYRTVFLLHGAPPFLTALCSPKAAIQYIMAG